MTLRHAPHTFAVAPSSSSPTRAVQHRRALAATAPVPRPLQLREDATRSQPGRARAAGEQGAGAGRDGSAEVHAAAAHGIAGPGGRLPHGDAIQHAFGRHEVGHVQAHVGGAAAQANEDMGAEAYASGDHVAFKGAPDLHTAAHEAAHVVQQRAGVALEGGVGAAGDRYEQHADDVADAVVQGRSAEPILDRMAGAGGGGGGGAALQHKGGAAGRGVSAGKLASQGIDKLSAENLKSVVFSASGQTRYNDKGEPRDPDGVTLAQYKAARQRLDDINRANGTPEPREDNLHGKRQQGKGYTAEIGVDGAMTSQVTPIDEPGGRPQAPGATTATPAPADGGSDQDPERRRDAGDDDAGDGQDGQQRREAPPTDPAAPPTQDAPRKSPVPVEVGGRVLDTGATASAAVVDHAYNDGTTEAKLEALSAGAGASAQVGVSATGVTASADANVELQLAKVSFRTGLEFPFSVGSEKVVIKGFVQVDGMLGAEAQAQVKAEVGKMQGSQPDGAKLKGMLSSNAGAFAGAKASVTIGAELEWQKQAPEAYTQQLEATVRAAAGLLGGPVGYMVAHMGGDKLGAMVLGKLFEWGPAGNDVIASLSGTLEGSAGIGAEGELSAGMEGSKIVFACKGALSFGIGAGFAAKAAFDPIAALKFGLVVGGELAAYVEGQVKAKLAELAGEVGELFEAAWEWVEADDNVREAVRAGVHTVVGPAERMRMLDRLLDISVAAQSEQAAIAIVEFSRDNGDLDQVLVGDVRERWEGAVSGQMQKALDYGSGTEFWVTVIDRVRWADAARPRGGHYVTVEWSGEHAEYNADRTVAATQGKHAPAFDGDGVRGFAVEGEPLAVEAIERGESGRVIAAFGAKAEAEDSAAGSHGVWARRKGA